MTFWWNGSRQQEGRALLTITSIPELPTLDPKALSDSQITTCREIYDRLKTESFLPANEAYRNPVRNGGSRRRPRPAAGPSCASSRWRSDPADQRELQASLTTAGPKSTE